MIEQNLGYGILLGVGHTGQRIIQLDSGQYYLLGEKDIEEDIKIGDKAILKYLLKNTEGRFKFEK